MPQYKSQTRNTATASLAEGEQVISGVAVGTGDVTRGLSGDRKVWSEKELRESAESLRGGDLKALHSEAKVGEVTDAGYVDGKGVVYEARVDDDELARAISNGRLTVSVEARHADGGTVETGSGNAMAVTEIQFDDMAIVQHGAAPSASANPGEAAALSPAEVQALLAEDDEDEDRDEEPASTEGDPDDIEISDSVETGLQNKVDEHNEEAGEGKQITLGQLKKVFRRGAGAWFSSNMGTSQSQWAYARVNEAISDIESEKAINHGNDNDIFEDDLDYNPPNEEQSAHLVEINGVSVDLEAPSKVVNAVEAAMDAKSEYDEIADCGTGVGEDIGQKIADNELTPDIVTSGGDVAQYGPSTYLDAHGDEGPDTTDPPTSWGREEWLGIVNGGQPRCGPVQKAMWGYYLEPLADMKEAVEQARETSTMAEHDSESDETVPQEYYFDNPGEAVTSAKKLGVGSEVNRDLAGDEMIHTLGDGEDTEFMPAPSHEELRDILRERGELAEHDDDLQVRIPMPSENVQLLYPEQSIASDAADAMGLSGTHPHDYEGEEWYMPGSSHQDFVSVIEGLDAGLAGYAPVATLNEYKSVGPISFRGTREGDLDESEIPTEDYEDHYFNAGDTKSDSSYPLVDGDGYLRAGNLGSAWDLRGQGDLDMPRESAERLMLNLGLVFAAPDMEANPLPQGAYDGRDDVGTPFAADASAVLAGRFSDVGLAVAVAVATDDPRGEDTVTVSADSSAANATTTTTTDMATSDTNSGSNSSDEQSAKLGGSLSRLMQGEMERLLYRGSGHESKAEMMQDMAEVAGHTKGHMRSIARGDVGCPSIDAIEAMSDILGADMGMLVNAAERDGCSYSMQSGHMDDEGDDEMSESMSTNKTTEQLKAELSDKSGRIELLEERVDELESERDQVATEYAESLAKHNEVIDAEIMAQKFEVSELATMYEEQEQVSVTSDPDPEPEPEPAVQAGDGEGGETSSLSASAQSEVAELEENLGKLEGRESRLATARREELNEQIAAIKGE